MKMDQPIYIIDGARTPIGSPYKSLTKFTASQMAAAVFKSLIERNNIAPGKISEIILGNAVSAGTGQNLARQAAYLAGLSLSTPAYTVSHVCGSGLQAVILASRSISAKCADIVIAGGSESATHMPNLVSKEHQESKNRSPIDSLVYDGLWCLLTGKHMGELCETLAQENSISREEQDRYALVSHQKAHSARSQGKFIPEIVPVSINKSRLFSEDERPRKNMDLEKLVSLPPAFKERGTITAGNSSVPSDGASALILAGSEAVEREHFIPRAKILAYSSIAVDPELTFSAGISAIQDCLQSCGLNPSDIDLYEISEAFAAQAILTKNKLNISDEKWNVHGGDIALGHPLGAAGSRILVTLLHALIQQKKRRGLCCVCLGGGGAIAMVIENSLIRTS